MLYKNDTNHIISVHTWILACNVLIIVYVFKNHMLRMSKD
jgi:hypothetical protein